MWHRIIKPAIARAFLLAIYRHRPARVLRCIGLFACITLPFFTLKSSAANSQQGCLIDGQTSSFGVATHFGFPRHQLSDMQRIRQAGIQSVRDEVFWDQVEDAQGQLRIPPHVTAYVNAALNAGLTPLLVLDYGHPRYNHSDKPLGAEAQAAFVRYAEFVIRQLRGKVRHFEIWNEWDIAIGGTQPGTAPSFAAFVSYVAERLRRTDPDLCLYAGGVTSQSITNGWLQSALAAGLDKPVNGIAIHPYNYYAAPKKNHPEAWYETMRELMNSHLPIVARPTLPALSASSARAWPSTELGWPSHLGRHGISLNQQADYAVRTRLLSMALPGSGGVWWYDWQDDGVLRVDAEHNFGLIDAKGQPKPAWHALVEVNAWLTDTQFKKLSPLDNTHTAGANGYWLQLASNPANPLPHEVHAFWNNEPLSDATVNSISIALSPAARKAMPIDSSLSATSLHTSKSCHLNYRNERWQLSVTPSPCLVALPKGYTLKQALPDTFVLEKL